MLIDKVWEPETGQIIGWLKKDHYYYQPEEYKALPKDKRAIFILRLLTIGDNEVYRNQDNYNCIKESYDYNVVTDTVKKCLIGWENYRGNFGKELKFNGNCEKSVPVQLQIKLHQNIQENTGLTDDEKTGLRILARLHSDKRWSKYNCEGCRITKGLPEKRGMESIYEGNRFIGCKVPENPVSWSVFSEEYQDNEIQYKNCPLKFIPASIVNFSHVYSYTKKFPHTAPSYDDQTKRYMTACNYYENEINSMRE